MIGDYLSGYARAFFQHSNLIENLDDLQLDNLPQVSEQWAAQNVINPYDNLKGLEFKLSTFAKSGVATRKKYTKSGLFVYFKLFFSFPKVFFKSPFLSISKIKRAIDLVNKG